MRPYLAIIRDSFREAFASRVLWILLILITLLMLAFAPLSMTEQRATGIHRSEVRDWPGFLQELASEAARDEPNPGKQVWGKFAAGTRTRILAALNDDGTDVGLTLISQVLVELNDRLSDPGLYDEQAWQQIRMDAQTREMVQLSEADSSEQDISYRNRLLLRAAFPLYLPTISSTRVFVTYLGNPVGTALPFSRELATPILNGIVAGIINFFVGTLGVFAAILVTAPIIPNTFESGSIDFLLSKPVSRVLLLLTKFLGGCAFIVLIACYFVVALWLILGTRFDLWNHRILLTIPLFLFLFAIYFSVSTFAGIRWKNATVSIVISILFWAACFTVGTSKGAIEQVFLNPDKLVKLVPIKDSIIAVRRSGRIVEWLPEPRGEWDEILAEGMPQGFRRRSEMTLSGPLFDRQNGELIYLRRPPPSFGRFRAQPRRSELFIGRRENASWDSQAGVELPFGSHWLFQDPEGRLLVVAAEGVFRASGALARSTSLGDRLLDLLPLTRKDSTFELLGPEPRMNLSMPYAAAIHPERGDLVSWYQDKLTLLSRNEDGSYERSAEVELTESKDVLLACAGETVFCILDDGEVLLLDGTSLATLKRFKPAGMSTPFTVTVSQDARWLAVVLHSGTLLLYDTQQDVSHWIGSSVSAACFHQQYLLVADRVARVQRYSLDSLERESLYDPEMSTLQQVHQFFLLPFYHLFPKPGELQGVIDYLMTDEDARPFGPPRVADLSQTHEVRDLAGPVKNGAWFIFIMLAICCIYVTRKDF